MSERMEELTKDIAELKKLLTQATRKRVQDAIAMELRKYETELTAAQDASVNSRTPSDQSTAAKTSVKKSYTTIVRNYSWDQSEKFMKIYVTLKNVHSLEKEKITSEFGDKDFKLHVGDLDGKNHELNITNLAEYIKPDSSYHKIKTDMVLVMLAKKELKSWTAVTAEEKRAQEARKPKTEKSGDPSDGLMDIMKQMYDDGDDQMKQMAELPAIEFVPTSKGGESLLCGSFKFRFNMRRNDGGRYWKCSQPKCKATAITDGNNRLVKVGEHSHPSIQAKLTAEEIVRGIKRRAVEEVTPIPRIYQEEVVNGTERGIIDEEVSMHLPQMNGCKSAAYRQRRKLRLLLPNRREDLVLDDD
ncbi:calcyclin-binding protein isoform X2 [Oratosquilla oratoria]|uniref:calcyclin-binding protein isoform X2 n=1 Tax=Oratosquilla oratoria TaxID=337810 RepID=UPI003F770479